MPAGFEVYNDYGTLLITDTNPSLAMRVKATVVSTGVSFPAVGLANAEMPAMAFTCSQTLYVNQGTWAGTTRNFQLNGGYTLPGSTSATVYIFDRPVSSGNSGLQVFDAAGNLTFDALGKYGRVSAVYAANGSYARVAGRDYAVMITSSRFRDEILLDVTNPATHRQRRITMTGGRVSATHAIIEDVIISNIIYASSDTPQVIRDTGSPSGVIVDVTGY